MTLEAWFWNCISHTWQKENTYSNYVDVDYGVPQGTVLVPILFLIYIKIIFQASNVLNTCCYVDDTDMVLEGNNWYEKPKQAEIRLLKMKM